MRSLRAILRRYERSERSLPEIREILEEAVRPQERIKIGSELAAFGERLGGLELEITRDQAQPEPADFG